MVDNEDLIEIEEGNDTVQNEVPFNPNEIVVNIVPRTVGQLVDMLEYNEILVPKFQRLPNLWNLKKKSRFIESLMLNLPIPLFYFDEGEDKKWRVIDGLQRISTLEHFILGNQIKEQTIGKNKEAFALQDLEFKKDYNGKTWDQLPKDVQRRIQTVQVTINLIGKGTSEVVKYNIFSRINQGGIELKAQEIRTALFQGYKNDFLERLVSKDEKCGQAFVKATADSISDERQENLDFATRFVSFYLLGYEQYLPDMDSFLTKGTDAIPINPREQEKIISDFQNAMELAFLIFKDDAFRKRRNKDDKRKPINKPLFEVISVHFAKLSDKEREALLNKKDSFLDNFIKLQNEKDSKFWNAITTGTATLESIRERHKQFIKIVDSHKV